MIEFHNVKKVYGSTCAVDIRDLKIGRGGICGLIGPEGAGKTTLVQMLTGLETPTSGNVSISGRSPRDIEIKRKLGYIPDRPALYKSMTGFEFIYFIAKLYGLEDSNHLKTEMIALAQLVSLEARMHHSISSYTEVERQKISIISGLVHKPKILVMDEPLIGLNPTVVKNFKLFLKEFNRLTGNTIIITMRNLDAANDFCTDMVMLGKGRMGYHGRIEDFRKMNFMNKIRINRMQGKG